MFETIQIWADSLQGVLAEQGITVSFSQSGSDRPNGSCSLNLRRGDSEADLVVWESGEGELALVASGEDGMTQEHLEGLADQVALAEILARMVQAIGLR